MLVLLAGCQYGMRRDVLRQQASEDLSCPADDVTVTHGSEGYRASGCGQDAQYDCPDGPDAMTQYGDRSCTIVRRTVGLEEVGGAGDATADEANGEDAAAEATADSEDGEPEGSEGDGEVTDGDAAAEEDATGADDVAPAGDDEEGEPSSEGGDDEVEGEPSSEGEGDREEGEASPEGEEGGSEGDGSEEQGAGDE